MQDIRRLKITNWWMVARNREAQRKILSEVDPIWGFEPEVMIVRSNRMLKMIMKWIAEVGEERGRL